MERRSSNSLASSRSRPIGYRGLRHGRSPRTPGGNGILSLCYIDSQAPAYAEATELRYQALYAEWNLPRSLVDDPDPAEYRHLVATDDDVVVGYARIRLVEGDAKILQLCVAGEQQGLGLATAMMMELMRLARSEGRVDVYLDAREHVIAYYRKLGFVPEGDIFLSPRTGTPHLVMRYTFD